jgi:hypothetical protein
LGGFIAYFIHGLTREGWMGRLRLIRRSRPSLSIPCVLVLIGGHWFPSTIARITAVRLVAAQPCRPTQPQAQCLILRGGDGWGPEGLNYSRFDKLECSETESTSSDASSVRTLRQIHPSHCRCRIPRSLWSQKTLSSGRPTVPRFLQRIGKKPLVNIKVVTLPKQPPGSLSINSLS